jgi:hypothetical protein
VETARSKNKKEVIGIFGKYQVMTLTILDFFRRVFQFPLHDAAINGKVDIIEFLLANTVDINQPDVSVKLDRSIF